MLGPGASPIVNKYVGEVAFVRPIDPEIGYVLDNGAAMDRFSVDSNYIGDDIAAADLNLVPGGFHTIPYIGANGAVNRHSAVPLQFGLHHQG